MSLNNFSTMAQTQTTAGTSCNSIALGNQTAINPVPILDMKYLTIIPN